MSLIRSFEIFLEQNNTPIHQKDEKRIVFKKDDLYYVFLYDDQDPVYFRLVLPKVDSINNSDIEKLKKLFDLSAKYKGGQIYLFDKDVWLSVELFVIDPEIDTSPLYKRALDILKSMYDDYRRLFNDIDDNGEEEKKDD